jgi:U4/U6 small nuclear ribonucleoprotein PRP3
MQEWWDLEFLPAELKKEEQEVRCTYKDLQFEAHPTVNLIHHPAYVKVHQKAGPKGITLMLTKKERRKIRRKNRMERERDKQDLIRLGLIPKEQSRLKLSNLMKVLTDDAVAAPSAMEKRVRDQVAERLKAHNMENLSRKLTPAERRAKATKKLAEDTSHEVHALLFRVNDLSSGKKRFKIEMNAKQYNLTGHVVICAPGNLYLYVEFIFLPYVCMYCCRELLPRLC